MIFVLVFTWLVAAILIITDPKMDYIRYAALMLFIGGLAALGRIVVTTAAPFVVLNGLTHSPIQAAFENIHLFCSFVSQTGLPYSFLLFSIAYSGFFGRRTKTIFAYLMLVPPLGMLLTPFPDGTFRWGVLYVWVCPYYLTSFCLLVAAVIKEKNTSVRRSKMFTVLLTFPQMFLFLSDYTLTMLKIYNAWRFMIIAVPVWFVLVVVLALKNDFLGIRLKVERKRLDSTLKAVTSGTRILNHSLKNELGKINIVADRLKADLESEDPDLIRSIDVIKRSTCHLLEMIQRIKRHTREIAIEKLPQSLSTIIEASIFSMNPYIEKNHIRVNFTKYFDRPLLCDSLHLGEVFSNILINACEALEPNGYIDILLHENPTHVIVSVRDNGTGIEKENIPHLFDPFFTTRNNERNFGLGLGYCYSVMQKHHGSIDIQSELGFGTTVFLYFPNRLISDASPIGAIDPVIG